MLHQVTSNYGPVNTLKVNYKFEAMLLSFIYIFFLSVLSELLEFVSIYISTICSIIDWKKTNIISY